VAAYYPSADEHAGCKEAKGGTMAESKTLDEFFSGYEQSRQILEAVYAVVAELGPVEMRVTKSQIAALEANRRTLSGTLYAPSGITFRDGDRRRGQTLDSGSMGGGRVVAASGLGYFFPSRG
jgi:hypothetical protein